jgi:mRNA-degrading endonuclease HigB of HigAB toxin-antitoxin module
MIHLLECNIQETIYKRKVHNSNGNSVYLIAMIAFKMQIIISNTLFARSAMIISKQQSADGTCPE